MCAGPMAIPGAAPKSGSLVQAIAAAPGISIGPAHIQVLQAIDYPLRGESAAVERERLKQALTDVRRDIEGLIERSKSKAIREIFITHQEMLDDPELTDEVDTRLKQGESAEAAWMSVIEAAAKQQEALQ